MKIEVKDPLMPKISSVVLGIAMLGNGILMDYAWRSSGDALDVFFCWMLIVCGALSAASGIWKLCDRRPLLRIDDAGIFDRRSGVGFIPWADVRDAFLQSDHLNYRICLDVVNAESYVKRTSAQSWIHRRRKAAAGETVVSINLYGTGLLPQTVLPVIRARIAKKELVS